MPTRHNQSIRGSVDVKSIERISHDLRNLAAKYNALGVVAKARPSWPSKLAYLVLKRLGVSPKRQFSLFRSHIKRRTAKLYADLYALERRAGRLQRKLARLDGEVVQQPSALGDVVLEPPTAEKFKAADTLGQGFSIFGQDIFDTDNRAIWAERNKDAICDKIRPWLKGRKVLSLDVFDTFLLRGPESETARFLAQCQEAKQYLDLPQTLSAEGLTLLRKQAMQLAYRTKISGGDGNIAQVCRFMAQELGDPALAERLIAMEIDFETKSLAKNAALSQLVREFSADGGQVLLLSDMYLRADDIRQLAQNVDPNGYEAVSAVISSADHAASKRQGSIFSIAQDKIGAKGAEILHIGDSFHSDVSMARRAGWCALHFPISDRERAARRASLKSVNEHFSALDIEISGWSSV